MSRMFSAYVAWAYFRSPNSILRSLRWISRGAMLGLALSLSILIVTLSVMNGFERDIRHKLLTKSPHIIAFHTHELALPEEQEKILQVEKAYQVRLLLPQWNYQQIHASVSDRVETRQISSALLSTHTLAHFIDFIGICSSSQTLTQFSLDDFTVFDDRSPILLLPMKDFAIVKDLGAVKIQGFWLHDPFDVDAVTFSLKQKYPHVQILSWKDQHQSFFDALSGEKRLISFVLSLLIILIYIQFALTLVLLFNDKKHDLIVLNSCCENKNMVYETFFLYGCYNVVFGTVIGLIGGSFIATILPSLTQFLENTFQFEFLPYQHYSSHTLPSDLLYSDLIYTGLFALIFGVLTSHVLANYGQSRARRERTYKGIS